MTGIETWDRGRMADAEVDSGSAVRGVGQLLLQRDRKFLALVDCCVIRVVQRIWRVGW